MSTVVLRSKGFHGRGKILVIDFHVIRSSLIATIEITIVNHIKMYTLRGGFPIPLGPL